MRLCLVHHGEAVPEEQDPKRPLTQKGRADARKVAAFAVQRAGVRVDRIVHSEKLRARQTAEAWLEVLPKARLVVDARLNPSSDPPALADDIARAKDDMLLVGHLPHLRQLTAYLVCGDENRSVLTFPGGGAVCLERSADGAWSIIWIIAPNLLS